MESSTFRDVRVGAAWEGGCFFSPQIVWPPLEHRILRHFLPLLCLLSLAYRSDVATINQVDPNIPQWISLFRTWVAWFNSDLHATFSPETLPGMMSVLHTGNVLDLFGLLAFILCVARRLKKFVATSRQQINSNFIIFSWTFPLTREESEIVGLYCWQQQSTTSTERARNVLIMYNIIII